MLGTNCALDDCNLCQQDSKKERKIFLGAVAITHVVKSRFWTCMCMTQVLSSGVTCELKGLELVMCPNVAFSSSRFHQL